MPSIVLRGFSDQRSGRVILPIEGAVYLNFFGSGHDPLRNLIQPDILSTLTGTPSLEAEAIRTKGNESYVTTGITPRPSTDYTLVAVGGGLGDGAAPLLSNYSDNGGIAITAGNPSSGGTLMTPEAGMRAQAGSSSIYHRVQLTGIPQAATKGIASVFRAAGPFAERITGYNLSAGTKSSNAGRTDLTAVPEFSLGGAFRIGDHTASAGGGSGIIRAAAIFERALSDAELAVMWRYLAGYYARRNITL